MLDSNPHWLAHCLEIKELEITLAKQSTMHLNQASLILVTDGQCTLSINGHEEHIIFGQLIALESGSIIQFANPTHLDFSAYIISFNIYDTYNMNMKIVRLWGINRATGYDIQSVSDTVVATIRVLFNEATAPLTSTLKQFILYSLLKNLQQERQAQQTDEATLEQRMERTVTYIKQNYKAMMTRDELAAIAGYSPSYYSRKFTELYRKTPIEYLIRYRILRAQERLLLSDDLSKNVAKRVGFEDAQYFSRQFKEVVGVSPKHFKKSIAAGRICFLSPAHAEIAIALGVIPDCVIVTSSLTPSYQRELFHKNGVKMLEMPQYVIQQNIIVQQQPDLIIGSHLTEEMKQHFQTIAPIITRLPDELNELIPYFGQLFNRQGQAKHLMKELATEVKALSDKIHKQININNSISNSTKNVINQTTVLHLRVEELGYRYVGKASTDSAILLYKELGLNMPHSFTSHEHSFNVCSLQQLEDANPTYLFIEKRIMDYYSADHSLSRLQQSEQWGNLDAVKDQRVFYVDTGLWINNCSVFGKREVMKQIEEAILGSESSSMTQ